MDEGKVRPEGNSELGRSTSRDRLNRAGDYDKDNFTRLLQDLYEKITLLQISKEKVVKQNVMQLETIQDLKNQILGNDR
jgi:hypothetical protein